MAFPSEADRSFHSSKHNVIGTALAAATAVLLLVVGLPGCKKAPTDASLVGKWKVTVVEGGAGGLLDSLKGATLDLRADHTFRAKNEMIGGYGGTWALDGSTLTLTTGKDESSLIVKSSTLTVEGARLARHDGGVTIAYDRLTADAGAPRFKLTADQYIAESKQDEAAFKAKYKGTIVEIEGVVNTITTNFGGDNYVIVYGPPQPGAAEPGAIQGIACFTIDKHPKLLRGQKVKLRGEGAETVLMPRLVEVEIVETGPSPADEPLPDLTPPEAKLVPFEFKFGEMTWIIDAPPDAAAKDFFGDTKLTLGKGFGLRINMLEDRVAERKKQVTEEFATHRAKRLLIDTPDTVLVETLSASSARFMFAADRTVNFVDFGARSASGDDFEFAPLAREQCLLAMKCLKTLRAKNPPTGPVAILKWMDVDIDPANPKSARLMARDGESLLPLLTKIPELREVSFDGTHLTDKGMKTVAHIPNLQSLSLDATKVTDDGLHELVAAAKLEKLIVSRGRFSTGPAIKGTGLAGLKSLKTLWIANSAIDDLGIVALADLTALRDLRIGKGGNDKKESGRISNAAVAVMTGMKGLEELGIEGSSINDADLERLAADHPMLKELILDDTFVRGASFAALAKLPLKKLSLDSDAIKDAGLKALAACKTLESLNLANAKITDAGLSPLTGLPALSELNLSGTSVTDQGLLQLAKISHLRSLNLAGTKITDAGLKHLYGLKDLYYVDTENTAVTKPGMKAFEDRPRE